MKVAIFQTNIMEPPGLYRCLRGAGGRGGELEANWGSLWVVVAHLNPNPTPNCNFPVSSSLPDSNKWQVTSSAVKEFVSRPRPFPQS